MPNKVKLRPMAEAPKTWPLYERFGPSIVAYDQGGTPLVVFYDSLTGLWRNDGVVHQDSWFMGWLPLEVVEHDSSPEILCETVNILREMIDEGIVALGGDLEADTLEGRAAEVMQELTTLRQQVANVRKFVAAERDADKRTAWDHQVREQRQWMLDRIETMIGANEHVNSE